MATRLEDIRSRDANIAGEKRVELVDSKKQVFHPNLFVELSPSGLLLWSESNKSGMVIPDAALPDLKKRLTYLLGTA